jgi:hypothetical protein
MVMKTSKNVNVSECSDGREYFRIYACVTIRERSGWKREDEGYSQMSVKIVES